MFIYLLLPVVLRMLTLESEGNQDANDDKFNRVDIKAKNDRGELEGHAKGRP